MAEINDGALYFDATLDNEKLIAAMNETLRRVQGFSDAVVGSGDVMDKTTQEIVECIEIQRKVVQDLETTYSDLNARINTIEPGEAQNVLMNEARQVKDELDAERQGLVALMNELNSLQATNNAAAMSMGQIRTTLGQIGVACEEHENELIRLEDEYKRLSTQMSDAFMSGHDDEYRALQSKVSAIKGEITVRKQILKELRDQSDALEEEATKLEKAAQEAENAAKAHVSFRTRLREVREELATLELSGDTDSSRYKELQQQLGELSEAMDAITTQQNMLKRGERMWDGLLSGLSGVSGMFSAAQGAVALFAGENENLQKIMLKVQSLMAITIGLKEVQLALDKDEAFQLVVVRKAKELLTVAETKFATALGVSNVAAKALMATLTLGLSVAITATIALISKFASKSREVQKAQEEWYKSIVENAYKPIGSIELLSAKWNALGDDLEAKKKFIEANKKAFDELGVSINGVTDAENLLIANKGAFVDAMVAKAKAAIYTEQAMQATKDLMEAQQKLEATPKAYVSKRGTYKDGYGVERKGITMVKSSDWQEAEDAVNAAQAKLDGLLEKARLEQAKQVEAMNDANIDSVKQYEAGTIGALEQAIQNKQAKLKELKIGSKEFSDTQKLIADLQKQLDKAQGRNNATTKTSTNTQDPFIEKLNKYKSEYQRFNKWVNSGDAVLVRSANAEFQGLLAEGATYIDYLKNQREQILAVDVASRTKEQNKQLRQLNDAIAEETKQTVLEAFNNELNEQLSNARTVIEMLNIIEQRRKELSNDGTDLDNAKAESLNEAENNAQEQLKQETESLLEEYASYVEQKRRLEEQFNNDVALMMRQREQATTDAQRAEIDKAIQNRTNKYNTDVHNIGGVDYDAMLAEYGTFEQRKQAIIDEYDEKRKVAQEAGNAEMVDALNKAQEQALSKFALEELQAHPDWELMFGDLDEISTRKLQELIDKINGLDGAYLGIEFDPKDLETLKNKISEIQDEIQERNPFKALVSSIKEYGKASDDESKKKSLTNMFESASSVIDLVGGTLDAVTSGLEKMGVTMDEETQAIIGDLGGILGGASQVAQGIATGNPLSIIQGSIGLLSSAFDLFNIRDRKAEKQIKAHKKALEQLQSAYAQLEWQIEKALGGDVYSGQMQAIRNMEQQRQELQGMWEAEESKKKTDGDKVNEYKEQYAELGRQIEDMYDEISKDILQTDAVDFAGTLGDALVEAFKQGEDAATAFENTVNQVLQNAIVNQLKKKFLEKQLQGALDDLENSMGYWNGDDFVFDGLTDAEIEDFKRRVQAAANNFNEALGIYSDIFKDLNIEEPDDSLTGAVKGVSEETASILAGQVNAIRINQLEATSILRQSLQTLNTIAANTAYNRYLLNILSEIKLLKSTSDGSLRSQGLS